MTIPAHVPLHESREPMGWRSLRRYLAFQLEGFHPRLILVQMLVRIFPRDTFGVARAAIYRLAGFRFGNRVRVHGPLTFSGRGAIYENLVVGDRTQINSPVHIELHAPVHIGKRCGIGHHVVIITMNHEFGPPDERTGALVPAPVTIGDGVWIGACVTILPGVTIGDGAFVAAGAVVGRSVPPNARVASPRLAVAGYFGDAPHAGDPGGASPPPAS